MKSLKKYTDLKPKTAIVLGSGISLSKLKLKKSVTIPLKSLIGLESKIKGHKSIWHIGLLEKTPILIQQGRLHYYEGLSIDKVLRNITLMKNIGIKTLILTTACGAINSKYKPKDIMVVSDHINLLEFNPLREIKRASNMKQFPSMDQVYDKKLLKSAIQSSKKLNIKSHRGILAGLPGPSYETPAEVKMLRKVGIDAVTMSTVPEAMYAHSLGIKVMGLACIANKCGAPVNHKLVLNTIKKLNPRLEKLFSLIIKSL